LARNALARNALARNALARNALARNALAPERGDQYQETAPHGSAAQRAQTEDGAIDAISDQALAALAGLAGGAALGLAARRVRFCTLGAIEGAIWGDDRSGVRMWGVALGVAILASFGAAAAGLFDPAASFHMRFAWNPAASIIGGLMFGYGMALAGNCGYGALARLGGGDLRAFVVVLVMGISAAMAIGGPTAEIRDALFAPEALEAGAPLPSLAHGIAGAVGVAPGLVAGIIGGALILSALAGRGLARRQAIWAGVVGLSVASGWAATGLLEHASFGALPVVSHSFAAPMGDSLLWSMTASGGGLGFGVGSVFGVALGALAGSWHDGRFRWEACEDPAELARQIFGAFLMGTGGVTALGCSVGQGLTAFSLLAYGAPVTLAAITLGAALGLRHLIRGFHAI
jgi:hypothetical protein